MAIESNDVDMTGWPYCTRPGCAGSVSMTGIPRRPSITTSTPCSTPPRPAIASMSRSSKSQPCHGSPTRSTGSGVYAGILALTGLALTVEIGDWSRFTGASIGPYVGLVPTEYSSGASRMQSSITKAGNAHVRRLLIEAAWHHRASYRNPGPTMRARWAKVDPAHRAPGHSGNRHQQWCRFVQRKKHPVVANVAIARELAGWCWSLATLD